MHLEREEEGNGLRRAGKQQLMELCVWLISKRVRTVTFHRSQANQSHQTQIYIIKEKPNKIKSV